MVLGAAAALGPRTQQIKERNLYADTQEEDAVLSRCTAWQSAGQYLTTTFSAIDSPRMVAVLGLGREGKGKLQYWDHKRVWLTFEGLHLDDTQPTFMSITTSVRISGILTLACWLARLPTGSQKGGCMSCCLLSCSCSCFCRAWVHQYVSLRTPMLSKNADA